MTFSLLAFEPDTQSVGICSVTFGAAHGNRCPHFQKDVGIITSQAHTNRYHGEVGIQLLALGFSPEECLRATSAKDVNIDARQIAICDCQGRTAAYTGTRPRDFKGHLVGDKFVAAGNALVHEAVLHALVEGFQAAKDGELADRLLMGCRAAEKAGGGLDGQHSGYLVVIRPDQMQPWGAHVDIRIDYAADVIPAMEEALSKYRYWQRDRMRDPKFSLDGQVPARSLRGGAGVTEGLEAGCGRAVGQRRA